MDVNNQVCHNDPQFVKLLKTCLKMEIAAAKEIFQTNSAKIKRLKEIMRSELDRRKKLKEKVAQLERIRITLNESLTSLHVSTSEISDTLEAVKANADDQYELIQLRSQEYRDIVAEYKETWHTYRAMYEEFPLAKSKNAAKIHLEKLQITYMIMTYKKEEMMTIIKQRRCIDWIRLRSKIIEFASVMVEHLKMEQKLTELKTNVEYRRKELRSIEMEMQVQRKMEEDQERLRKQKMLEMAPPKINIPYQQMYTRNQHSRVHHREWKKINESFDDTTSVNTVALEELCVNESAIISPDEIEMEDESVCNDDLRDTTDQTETYNLKDILPISEKTDTRVLSLTPELRERVMTTDNAVEIFETHYRQEAQKVQQPAKMQASFGAKENSLKHSAAKNLQDEIDAKRIRIQRGESKEKDQIATLVPSVENAGLKPSLAVPKIKKIETVHYDMPSIMAMTKSARHSSIATDNVSSPQKYIFPEEQQYEFCDSNMSFTDQDFISKAPSSLCDGSLCNYKFSSTSAISPMLIEKDAQTTAPTKSNLQQEKKNQLSDDKESPFGFSSLIKKAKNNDFVLF